MRPTLCKDDHEAKIAQLNPQQQEEARAKFNELVALETSYLEKLAKDKLELTASIDSQKAWLDGIIEAAVKQQQQPPPQQVPPQQSPPAPAATVAPAAASPAPAPAPLVKPIVVDNFIEDSEMDLSDGGKRSAEEDTGKQLLKREEEEEEEEKATVKF